MRLVPFLLIGPLSASLLAQSQARALPWKGQPEPPWQVCEAGSPPPPMPSEVSVSSASSRRIVSLTAHGLLRIVDDRGLVRLRLGLPGRPMRMWRDGGTPLALSDFPCSFPADTPLSKGIENAALTGLDFRPSLKGLLWILDDGGQRLTVVHPATGQVSYLNLPGGGDLDLRMYPDRLELREIPDATEHRQETLAWCIPWLGLFPQFLHLGAPPALPPLGTALNPFTSED